MDLEEYNQIQSELKELKKLPEDGSLTPIEQQEATGILLVRALQNPGLFRTNMSQEINLGKYKVIFVQWEPAESVGRDYLKIKFVRT